MNKQEIFDYVITQLRKQKVRSYNAKDYQCMYRMKNGLKCAIGHLIPDNKYDQKFDKKEYTVSALIEYFNNDKELNKIFNLENKWFLISLQIYHDNPDSWDENGLLKTEQLIGIIKEYNLQLNWN